VLDFLTTSRLPVTYRISIYREGGILKRLRWNGDAWSRMKILISSQVSFQSPRSIIVKPTRELSDQLTAQSNLQTPIVVGLNPWGVSITPGGKIYTANFGDNTISVIDTATNTPERPVHGPLFCGDATPRRGDPCGLDESCNAFPLSVKSSVTMLGGFFVRISPGNSENRTSPVPGLHFSDYRVYQDLGHYFRFADHPSGYLALPGPRLHCSTEART